MVTNAALEDTVHAHPAPALTLSDAVPPVPATLNDVLESAYVHVGDVGAVGDAVLVRTFEQAPAESAAVITIRQVSSRTDRA
jgi:hypothetical protein